MPKAFPLGLSAVFIANNGFVSAIVARVGAAATPLWAVGLAAINPVAGRTNGTVSTIYTLTIENPTAGAVTAWLEVGGAVVTSDYHLNAGETGVFSFVAGLNIGNQDIDCNASANLVEFQVVGIQV